MKGHKMNMTEWQAKTAKMAARATSSLALAEALMTADNSLWEAMGIRSGSELARTPNMALGYVRVWKGVDMAKATPATLEALTDDNYHSLVAALSMTTAKAVAAIRR